MTRYILIDSFLNVTSVSERDLSETISNLDFENQKLLMIINGEIYYFKKNGELTAWESI